MKEIREWLASGQDYAVGLALYETHGSSQVVLKALRHGASEFTRQKLKKELAKLATAPVAMPAKVAHAPAPASVSAKSRPTPPVSVPGELQAQRRAWFAERNHLHPQLELVATDAERLVLSLRILELGELIDQSYAAAPDLDPTRTVSSRFDDVADAGEIRRLLANLKPQRTKLRKRPDRATDLAQVELDIKTLESKL